MLRKLLLAVALCCAPMMAWAATPITVTATTWVQVAAAGTTVQVQNLSTAGVRLSVSASAPASTFDGEVLVGGDNIRKFDGPLPNPLWAIALNGPGATIAVNPIGATGKGTTANPSAVADPNNAAFQGAVPMTVGMTYAAQRSIGANCTAAGNMSVTFGDASTLVVPVVVGFQTFPFAVTAVNSSGTTATCTYANLK